MIALPRPLAVDGVIINSGFNITCVFAADEGGVVAFNDSDKWYPLVPRPGVGGWEDIPAGLIGKKLACDGLSDGPQLLLG
jgi:hypothetical protein